MKTFALGPLSGALLPFWLGTGAEGVEGQRPQLHIGTFADIFDERLILPMASASSYGFSPLLLGLGAPITAWAVGMGRAWNTYRHFVFEHTAPDDVVLLFDAFDVIFQGSTDELLDMYLKLEARTGKQIFYNADIYCSSSRKDEFPKCITPWCYLNSGIYMGRSSALRVLFEDELPAEIKEKDGRPKRLQNVHIDFLLEHPDIAMLDYHCELSQVVLSIPEINLGLDSAPELPPETTQLVLKDGRLHNSFTNTTPLMLHFPGPGHWPDYGHHDRTGSCYAYEFLRYAHPSLLSLMEERGASFGSGTYSLAQPWKPVCTHYVSPFQRFAFMISYYGDYIVWSKHEHGSFFFLFLAVVALAGYRIWSRILQRRHRCVVKQKDEP